MVARCNLIVLCKVLSNRETASSQVSDEFLRSLDFSMSARARCCLHVRYALATPVVVVGRLRPVVPGLVHGADLGLLLPVLGKNGLRTLDGGSQECAGRPDDLLLFHHRVVTPMYVSGCRRAGRVELSAPGRPACAAPRLRPVTSAGGAASGGSGIGSKSMKQRAYRSDLGCIMGRQANLTKLGGSLVYVRRVMPQG